MTIEMKMEALHLWKRKAKNDEADKRIFDKSLFFGYY